MLEKIKEITAESLGADAGTITEETSFKEDLGADSLDLFEQIKKMVADNLGVEESKITENASFKDDLGADSLDLFELTMALEDEYGIEIPSEDLEQIQTVGDVVKYLEAHK